MCALVCSLTFALSFLAEHCPLLSPGFLSAMTIYHMGPACCLGPVSRPGGGQRQIQQRKHTEDIRSGLPSFLSSLDWVFFWICPPLGYVCYPVARTRSSGPSSSVFEINRYPITFLSKCQLDTNHRVSGSHWLGPAFTSLPSKSCSLCPPQPDPIAWKEQGTRHQTTHKPDS
jgi:hypothetical protein